jgi:polygalacturonase
VTNRRDFLRALAGYSILSLPPHIGLAENRRPQLLASFAGQRRDPWEEVPRILGRIVPPQFSEREFNVLKFGAVGDNKTDCTEAFHKAIVTCHSQGGGRVRVPEGQFLTGAIRLLSGVNLHLTAQATIRFSRDSRKYPLVFTRWEGIELMNFSPFLYAFEQEKIAITGEGTLDGNSDCQHWWSWTGRRECGWTEGQPDQKKDRNLLHEMGEKGVPVQERVFGEGHFLRPQFIQPYRCKNVLIEGVTVLNSPMWNVNPVLCTNVTVRKVTVNSSGPNTDGCDPESCADVLIEDCIFNTGDDCIAIKSGRNADGRRLHVPSQNIIVRGCHMKDGHGAVTLGSEISGGVHNVFAENCTMDSPHLQDALRIKNNAMRGGLLENIYARNIQVGQVAVAGLSIDFYYEEGQAGKFTPVARNIEVRNMRIEQTKYALYLRGFSDAPIENIQLRDCDFVHVAQPSVLENVKGLSLENVRINGKLVAYAASSQTEFHQHSIPWS